MIAGRDALEGIEPVRALASDHALAVHDACAAHDAVEAAEGAHRRLDCVPHVIFFDHVHAHEPRARTKRRGKRLALLGGEIGEDHARPARHEHPRTAGAEPRRRAGDDEAAACDLHDFSRVGARALTGASQSALRQAPPRAPGGAAQLGAYVFAHNGFLGYPVGRKIRCKGGSQSGAAK